MPALRVAAVQAAYVLMDRDATIDRETLVADLDLLTVAIQRRHLDPAGHYNRPDVFRLHVDTSPRPAVVETSDTSLTQATASPQNGAVQHGTVPHVAAEHVAAQNSE